MTTAEKPRYKRILLKLSGEGLTNGALTIDPETLGRIAREIKGICALGVQVCLVLGGGQHLSRRGGCNQGNGSHNGRLYGHVGDGDERAGVGGCVSAY